MRWVWGVKKYGQGHETFRDDDENPGRKGRPSLGCGAGCNLMDEPKVLEGRADGVQLGSLEHSSELGLSVVYWGCANEVGIRTGLSSGEHQ